MARTLVGTLILRLQENISQGAGKAAGALNGLGAAVDNLGKRGGGFSRLQTNAQKLEKDLARLGTAPWGARMQAQLERLGAGSKDIERVRSEWEKLVTSMNSRGLKKGAMAQEIGNWRAGVIGHFTAVRLEAEKTKRSLANIWKPMATAAGLGTGAYVVGRAGRAGVTAASDRQREYFRQDMASIPMSEKAQIRARSIELSKKYPSVSATDIMEMARAGRNMMGTTPRGLSILEDMVKGMVTLQSTKGVGAAPDEMNRMLRGIDNLGQNVEGELGIKNTKEIINGMIKAVQIEGKDLNVGELFKFAKRAKVAGPGLDTSFIYGVAPALMQDMGADTAGTALGSAYKSFVIGDRSQAGRRYMMAQQKLGLRSGLTLGKGGKIVNEGEFIGADLFAKNPLAWSEKYLIPALTNSGVDLKDDTAVTKAIAQLSGNTNATGMLARIVTQREQIARLTKLYENAMGVDAANGAGNKDPFVAYEGAISGLRELSAAAGEFAMPAVSQGLHNLAGGLKSLSAAISLGDITQIDTLGKALGALAGVAGVGAGGYFAVRGAMAILSAGPMLMQAATMLQAAAVAQGAKGVVGGGVIGAAASGGGIWSSVLGAGGAIAGLFGLGWLMNEGFKAKKQNPAAIGLENEAAKRREQRRAADEELVNRYRTPANPPAGGGFNAIVDVAPLDAAGAKAEETGAKMKAALDVKAQPSVDSSSIDSALAKAQQLLTTLGRIGTAAASAGSAVKNLGGAYSDYGVSP